MQELKKKYTTDKIKYCRRCYSPITAENESFGGDKNLCKSCIENSATENDNPANDSPTDKPSSENTATKIKHCRLCHSPIIAENELSDERELCKPCAESNETEYDTLRLSTPGPLRSLMGLKDENTEVEKKHCRCCGKLFTPAENEDGDFCNSCADSIAKKYYFNAPADLSDETDMEQDSDFSEADSELTETDSDFPEADNFTEADIKYCRRCGASITPEYRMYGIDDFCKSCIGSNAGRHYAKVRETDGKYCQGCGKIMTAENGMFGTNPDGSRNEEFCQTCNKTTKKGYGLAKQIIGYFLGFILLGMFIPPPLRGFLLILFCILILYKIFTRKREPSNDSPADEKFPNIAQTFGVFGIFLLAQISLFPFSFVFKPFISKYIMSLVFSILSFCAAIAYSIQKRKTGAKTFNFTIENKLVILLAIISVYALNYGIITPVLSLVPESKIYNQILLEWAGQPAILLFLHMVVIAPVFEELICRGIILDGFLKHYSPLKSILVSSLIFGLLHLNLPQIISGFLGGLFLGWIYYKTRSVSLPIILHATINLIALIALHVHDFDNLSNEPLYYGPPNSILIIVGLTSLFILSTYYLNKQFGKDGANPAPHPLKT